MADILLYDDPHTRLRTPHLLSALKRDLKKSGIVFNASDRTSFTNAIQDNPAVIFIAENIGAKCHHMRDISPETIRAMKQYVQNGGTIVLFGGAAHYAMSDITWHWDNGTKIYKGPKETFSFVNGQMIGPHHRHPISLSDPVKYNGCFEVPILSHAKDGTISLEKCWQGNCGNFVVNEDRVQHGFEILATYAHAQKRHGVAAISVPLGKHGGSFILCSVMPHYNARGHSPLWDNILSRVEQKISGKMAQPSLKRHL